MLKHKLELFELLCRPICLRVQRSFRSLARTSCCWLRDVNLPLDPGQAQALLEFSQAAPCVKGADTVGDGSVRSSSQLDPALLSCNNPGTICLPGIVKEPSNPDWQHIN